MDRKRNLTTFESIVPNNSTKPQPELQNNCKQNFTISKSIQEEVETLKQKIMCLKEENNQLRVNSIKNQIIAEQEEEFISNTLFKKIQLLKKEKEILAQQYEKEEEGLTNDLTKKLLKLQREKEQVELMLEQGTNSVVTGLLKKTEKLEAETAVKQYHLEQVRREKIELENTLEKQQEALVNRLWKRLNKLEAENRSLQLQLERPVSTSSMTEDPFIYETEVKTPNIRAMKGEISRLKAKLSVYEKENVQRGEEETNRTISDINIDNVCPTCGQKTVVEQMAIQGSSRKPTDN